MRLIGGVFDELITAAPAKETLLTGVDTTVFDGALSATFGATGHG